MASRAINTKTDKEVWATWGQGYIFKPIATALHQMTMKGIMCTIERVERRVSSNTVDRVGVGLRDMETGGRARGLYK